MLFRPLSRIFKYHLPLFESGWRRRERKMWKDFQAMVLLREEAEQEFLEDDEKLLTIEELTIDYMNKEEQPAVFDLASTLVDSDLSREIDDSRLFPDNFDLMDDEFFVDFIFFCIFFYFLVDSFFALIIYYFIICLWEWAEYDDVSDLDPTYDPEVETDSVTDLLLDNNNNINFSNVFFEFSADLSSDEFFEDWFFGFFFSSKSFRFFNRFDEKFRTFRRNSKS